MITATQHSKISIYPSIHPSITWIWKQVTFKLSMVGVIAILMKVLCSADHTAVPRPDNRASVRRAYAVYYVQKSAAYAEITHQRRTADFWKFLSTAKNGYWDVLSAEKNPPTFTRLRDICPAFVLETHFFCLSTTLGRPTWLISRALLTARVACRL